jgi:DNA-binding NarL/FixJ family response regulator
VASINILVVDDHDAMRFALCTALRSQPDFHVSAEASNGLEAVKKAEEFQPDLVLLDISLPDMSGIQVARLIRQIAPRVEILVVTQYDGPHFVREAFAAGAIGYLNKSDTGDELFLAVRRVHAKKKFVSKSVKSLVVGTLGIEPEIGDSSGGSTDSV